MSVATHDYLLPPAAQSKSPVYRQTQHRHFRTAEYLNHSDAKPGFSGNHLAIPMVNAYPLPEYHRCAETKYMGRTACRKLP